MGVGGGGGGGERRHLTRHTNKHSSKNVKTEDLGWGGVGWGLNPKNLRYN